MCGNLYLPLYVVLSTRQEAEESQDATGRTKAYATVFETYSDNGNNKNNGAVYEERR